MIDLRSKIAGLSIFLLAACGDTPVDESLISSVPASSQNFQSAQTAAAVCGREAPDWAAVEQALLANGYRETTDQRLQAIQSRQRSVILESTSSDVVVLVGSRGGEGACIVGLPGMTAEQSFQLALPWVAQYDLQTNAERGQGLAANAVQAWGEISEERIIFVAAYRTWDVLGVPGAAARLIYIKK